MVHRTSGRIDHSTQNSFSDMEPPISLVAEGFTATFVGHNSRGRSVIAMTGGRQGSSCCTVYYSRRASSRDLEGSTVNFVRMGNRIYGA
ncbi:hypothetical protein J6590_007281 [Homalodisca vitripennis]|nr:hypothetical protein J6590_007281 [Homalodisca vitripennis]